MADRASILVSGLLTAVLGVGCGLAPLGLEGECADGRRNARGDCCSAWTVPDGEACNRRPWLLPDAGDAVGGLGARWVDVAVTGTGEPVAAWLEVTTTAGRVMTAEPDGSGGLALRSPSEALAGMALQTGLAAGADGAAIVAWKQQYPGEQARVFLSEREPDGTWTDPSSEEQAFSFLPTAYEPQPIFFPGGERMVVWNQWMSTGYGVSMARKPPGGEWQLPADADDVLSPHYLFSNGPTPAVNERGDALISWYQSSGGSLLAWQSERFGHDGAFSKPGPDDYLSVPDTPVDSHPVANAKPALAPDGHGAVAWTQENGKGSVLVYLATRTPDGTWTRPSSVDDALSPQLGYARCAQIAFSPTGDLFVVWYQDTGAGNRVLAAHRTAGGEWIEPGREPTQLSTPGAEATYPALAVGPEGGVLAVWSERREEGWVIAARRRGSQGTDWGPIERLSPPDAGTAAQPAAAIGGAGEFAIVGWSQGTGPDDRAYFATVPVE
jgi:hypothetical protein